MMATTGSAKRLIPYYTVPLSTLPGNLRPLDRGGWQVARARDAYPPWPGARSKEGGLEDTCTTQQPQGLDLLAKALTKHNRSALLLTYQIN